MRLPEQGDSATSLVEWDVASVHASAGTGRQWPHHTWSGRLHLSMRLPEQGDSGHITRGVGGCICPCVCRSREAVATSLVEWEAASVHASAGAGRQWPHHSGVEGCICPGSSAGAGRQWPHHSWSGMLHLSMRLPEQGDSGHITRGVGGCICPCVCRSRETVATSLMEWEAASVHASAGAGRQWPHHSRSGRLHLSGFICRSRETVATSLMEWEAAFVRRLPEQGDSGYITHGVGDCSCPGVCRSRETVATSLSSGRL